MVALGVCSVAMAEMRTWKFKTGETIEAEYVKTVINKYRIKDANGKEYTIPIDQFDLSAEDKEYLALENPPPLKLEFRDSVVRKNFTMEQIGDVPRPPEQRGQFGVLIKQMNNQDYPYPLTVEAYAIGKEISGNRYILLDRFSSPFRLTEGHKSRFEYQSKRIVRLTDMWDFPLYGTDLLMFSRRGEEYYAFMVVVKDKRGKVIAVDASKDWMTEHLENLEERYIGNYMDETFQRTYPSRPQTNYGPLQDAKDRF